MKKSTSPKSQARTPRRSSPTMSALQQKFSSIPKELDLIDRDEELLGAVLAVLSKSHLLLIGPPGGGCAQLASITKAPSARMTAAFSSALAAARP